MKSMKNTLYKIPAHNGLYYSRFYIDQKLFRVKNECFPGATAY